MQKMGRSLSFTISLLDDDSYNTKAFAIEALGELKVLPPLLSALQEDSPGMTLRDNILKTLSLVDFYSTGETPSMGSVTAKSVYHMLIRALEHEQNVVRRAALEGLKNLRGGFLIDSLIYSLGDTEYEVRETAARVLRQWISREDLKVILIEKALSGDIRAVRAIGYLQIKDGFEPLLELLGTGDDRFTRSVILALGRLKDERIVEPLGKYTADPDKFVRSAADWALKELRKSDDTEEKKLFLYFKNADFSDQKFLLYTPVERSDYYPLDDVLKYLENLKTEVQIAALEALPFYENNEVENVIVGMLENRDPLIRLAAVKSLGAYSGEKRHDALIPLLKDRSKDVRTYTADLLNVSLYKYREIFFYLIALYALLAVMALIFCLILAKLLERSMGGWGFLCLIFPWLACLILPFLDDAYLSGDRRSSSYESREKKCTACHRVVPLSSQAGQRCPHCGAYWSSEETTYQS